MADGVRPLARPAGVWRTIALTVMALGLGAQALADEANDVHDGEQLAAKFCSPCHVIGEHPGPSFAEIANSERAAPDVLRAFLHSTVSNVSHPGAMPNPAFSERQIDEIAAYMATLRTAR